MDFELGMSFVSDQPEAVWVGDDGILQGKMRMREAWTEWAADIREQTNRRTEVTFVVLSSDLAFVTLKFTNASSTLMSGTVTPERSVFETLVWVREDGEWRILIGHESVARESWETVLGMR
jgi:ketosteroid isomerase-like protein